MNILDKIVEHKKFEIEKRKKITPLERIKDSQRNFTIRNFPRSLSSKQIDIIAEIKFMSPSLGKIHNRMHSAKNIAKEYFDFGASAISVLTDENYFGGKLDYLNDVRYVADIPILRKDFIVSEYQIWESYYKGADAILLIADALLDEELEELYSLAYEIGLHVLLEFHDSSKAKIVEKINPEIIGINCRDLKSMDINLGRFESMFDLLPFNSIKIAESGITKNSHLEFIKSLGYDAALIGSSLMKADSPGKALANLLRREPS